MSRRIARISARMALRTRTVSRSRTKIVPRPRAAGRLRPQNIGTSPFGLTLILAFALAASLVAFRDQRNAPSSGIGPNFHFETFASPTRGHE
jgi:uncharacterized protein HemX